MIRGRPGFSGEGGRVRVQWTDDSGQGFSDTWPLNSDPWYGVGPHRKGRVETLKL